MCGSELEAFAESAADAYYIYAPIVPLKKRRDGLQMKRTKRERTGPSYTVNDMRLRDAHTGAAELPELGFEQIRTA